MYQTDDLLVTIERQFPEKYRKYWMCCNFGGGGW
jgi:hypothetical protein